MTANAESIMAELQAVKATLAEILRILNVLKEADEDDDL